MFYANLIAAAQFLAVAKIKQHSQDDLRYRAEKEMQDNMAKMNALVKKEG